MPSSSLVGVEVEVAVEVEVGVEVEMVLRLRLGLRLGLIKFMLTKTLFWLGGCLIGWVVGLIGLKANFNSSLTCILDHCIDLEKVKSDMIYFKRV